MAFRHSTVTCSLESGGIFRGSSEATSRFDRLTTRIYCRTVEN